MVDAYLSNPEEVYVERRTILKPSTSSGVYYINKHLHTANWLVFVVTRHEYFVNVYIPADGRQVTVRVLNPSLLSSFPQQSAWGGAHWVMKRQWFIHHWTNGNL
jgi:hypothetical protein